MPQERILPVDPVGFIRQCVTRRQILWTYHVNMMMEKRSISRQMILDSVNTYELVEAYPDDKYLPSYLLWAKSGNTIFHILFAADVENQNVRIVTSYYPNPEEWDQEFKKRRKA